jgi:hypothetical protein
MPDLTARDRLDAQLVICSVHRKRLEWALAHLEADIPLTPESYSSLDEDRIEHWDQLIYRFGKLQDQLGEKVLPTLLEVLAEPVAGKPFLDQLARLEQLDVIPSVDVWLTLRKARNASAHEYTFHPTEGAILLNNLVIYTRVLLGILVGIEAFLVLRRIS